MNDKSRRVRKTPEQEVLERVRRIETRITTLAIGLGVDMNTQKPEFDKQPGEHATLTLPSINSSLKEIMKAVPPGFTGRAVLVIGGETIGQIELVDRT